MNAVAMQQPFMDPERDSAADFKALLHCLVVYAEIDPRLPIIEIGKQVISLLNNLDHYWHVKISVDKFGDIIKDLTVQVANQTVTKNLNKDFNLRDLAAITHRQFKDSAWVYTNNQSHLIPEAAEIVSQAICAMAYHDGKRKDQTSDISHSKNNANSFDNPIMRAIENLHDVPEKFLKLFAKQKKTSPNLGQDCAGFLQRILDGFQNCGLPSCVIGTVKDMTRKIWGVVDSKTNPAAAAELAAWGIKDGHIIEEPYFDYDRELAKNPYALMGKGPDLNHNLQNDKAVSEKRGVEKYLRHSIALAYNTAATHNCIRGGSSYKVFVETYIMNTKEDKWVAAVHPDLFETIKKIRAEGDAAIQDVLLNESSEYREGRAAVIARHFKPKKQNNVVEIHPPRNIAATVKDLPRIAALL